MKTPLFGNVEDTLRAIRYWRGLAIIGLTLCFFTTRSHAEPAPAIEQPSNEAAGKTPPHIDPKHPLTFRYQYYPPQSITSVEEGTCFVALFIDIDGWINAVQLFTSTSHPRLDAACIASVVCERMLPATISGKPTVGWFTTSISWALTDKKVGNRSLAGLAIPRLPMYYELQLGPKFYTAAALQRKEQGICMVHLLVNAKGKVSQTQLSKSTGFPDLDRACIDAVTVAEFTPAQAIGEAPIEAWTDLAMFLAVAQVTPPSGRPRRGQRDIVQTPVPGRLDNRSFTRATVVSSLRCLTTAAKY